MSIVREPTSHTLYRSLIVAAAVWASFKPLDAAAQSFVNRAAERGLQNVTSTNGVAVADYDNDGDLDIYFVARRSYEVTDASTWNRLYRNDGSGNFSAVTSAPEILRGLDGNVSFNPMGNKLGAAWGDYDGDGLQDVFLTHLGPDQLLHNDGFSNFSLVENSGLDGGDEQLSSSAMWFDYDNDGDLDLYVSVWEDMGPAPRDLTNRLYRNNGDGTFANVSETSGAGDSGKTWTTVSLDVNHDGFLDLYLANDFGPNKLYINLTDGTFADSTTAYNVEDIYHGMGLAVADCDGNGELDIYVTNITESGFAGETNPLFVNTGNRSFVNDASVVGVDLAGWGWGTEFFDMESDGDLDLFVGTGYFDPDYNNVLFRNRDTDGLFEFENVAATAGVNDVESARGVAVADFDNDGDLDILVSNVQDQPALYINETPQGNWLRVRLTADGSPTSRYGAVVAVESAGSSQLRYIHGVQYLAQNQIPPQFGLGSATRVDRVTVRWPSGVVDQIEDVDINQSIRIEEGVGMVEGMLVAVEAEATVAGSRIVSNYPNPFADETTFELVLDRPQSVELSMYDLLGRLVYVRTYDQLRAGPNELKWSRKTDAGSHTPNVYVYTIRSKGGNVIARGSVVAQ